MYKEALVLLSAYIAGVFCGYISHAGTNTILDDLEKYLNDTLNATKVHDLQNETEKKYVLWTP